MYKTHRTKQRYELQRTKQKYKIFIYIQQTGQNSSAQYACIKFAIIIHTEEIPVQNMHMGQNRSRKHTVQNMHCIHTWMYVMKLL